MTLSDMIEAALRTAKNDRPESPGDSDLAGCKDREGQVHENLTSARRDSGAQTEPADPTATAG